ncbi:ATP-dependent Zn protease [Bradyrhizobium japonicum]
MTDDALRGVAFHEAGHALVAMALGLHVARVEIIEEDHSGGTDAEDPQHLPIEDQIAICVAGMAAEEMFDAPSSHELAHMGDHGRVIELLDGIDEVAGNELRDRGHQRASDLLKAHAASVEAIAGQLLVHRKIDLSEYALISPAAQ